MTNKYSSRLRVALGLQQPIGAWTNGFIYDPAAKKRAAKKRGQTIARFILSAGYVKPPSAVDTSVTHP